jgi:hypothetical protein
MRLGIDLVHEVFPYVVRSPEFAAESVNFINEVVAILVEGNLISPLDGLKQTAVNRVMTDDYGSFCDGQVRAGLVRFDRHAQAREQQHEQGADRNYPQSILHIDYYTFKLPGWQLPLKNRKKFLA